MVLLQEEEAKLKPGTDKHIAFQCLKDAGAAGLNVNQIMEAAKQSGIKDLDDNSERVIQFVSPVSLYTTLSTQCPVQFCIGQLAPAMHLEPASTICICVLTSISMRSQLLRLQLKCMIYLQHRRARE